MNVFDRKTRNVSLLATLILVVTIFYGWFLNLAIVFNQGYDPDKLGEFIIRVIGIPIVPLGSIMGYFF